MMSIEKSALTKAVVLALSCTLPEGACVLQPLKSTVFLETSLIPVRNLLLQKLGVAPSVAAQAVPCWSGAG